MTIAGDLLVTVSQLASPKDASLTAYGMPQLAVSLYERHSGIRKNGSTTSLAVSETESAERTELD